MPKSDDDAKRWQETQAARIGRAVQVRRQHLGLSVAQLAERTLELGYPLHRVAIGKIESNNRAGKVDLAEIAVLAEALEIAAVELIYPPHNHEVETLPGRVEPNYIAAEWFSHSGFYGVIAEMVAELGRFHRQVSQVLKYRQDPSTVPAPDSGATPTELALYASDAARSTGLRVEVLYDKINRAVWPGSLPYEGFRMAMDIVDMGNAGSESGRSHG